ncbi:unnamed protein product [Rangifer tarandus platyrhynchus]|uniref:Uncharacterized protein n=2 Tax=Rangifer tarandus platyrhynchus TaxID=3082113 RepID=A0ACB0F6Q9_RANTA|nr:unnamed protein product [Rangifer tarandus platyrhynchus]CAI9708339.1 unnamed protein product [Rangifer tarandus platyrhynchus]
MTSCSLDVAQRAAVRSGLQEGREPAWAAEASLPAGRPQGRRDRHHGCPHHSGHPAVTSVTEGGPRLQAVRVIRPVVSDGTEARSWRKTIKENEVKVHGVNDLLLRLLGALPLQTSRKNPEAGLQDVGSWSAMTVHDGAAGGGCDGLPDLAGLACG